MRKLMIALLCASALTACGQQGGGDAKAPAAQAAVATPEEIAAETDRLNKWFADRWEEQLEFSPIQRTFLGQKVDYDKIDDMSEAGEDEQLEWRRKTVADLKKNFDYDKLTAEAKTSYDIWVYELDRAEKGLPFRRRQYVFTQMQGP